MISLATLRFKFIFAWTFLMRKLFPYSVGNNLAALTIPLLNPEISKQKPAFFLGLTKVFEEENAVVSAWNRHKALVGVTRFQSSFYAQQDISWINQCQLQIQGAENIQAYQRLGNGVLVMTYHHHFNMLFCNLLSRLQFPVTTIAMDSRASSPAQNFDERVKRIYEHAEKLLNGGEIVLIKPSSQIRSILRAFEKNHLVITANDFPGVFNDKNRKDFPFLNTVLSCPTGTVKLAVKKNIPIVAAYLNWQGGSSFELMIKPISNGEETIEVNEVMTNYLAVLEEAIQNQPGMWEGWKWLK